MYMILRSQQATNKPSILRQQCLSASRSLRHFTCSQRLQALESLEKDHEPPDEDTPFRVRFVGVNAPEIHSSKIETRVAKEIKSSTRLRLRKWELENKNDNRIVLADKSADTGAALNAKIAGTYEGVVYNPFENDSQDIDDGNGFSSGFSQDDLVDLGNTRPFLLGGDMVELNISNEKKPELAILVNTADDYSFSTFYTMSGKWVKRAVSPAYVFYIPGFVAPKEVDDLIPHVPVDDSFELNRLHTLSNALPRGIGAPLVIKMVDFWNQTLKTYRRFAHILDRAHQNVASDTVLRNYTLEDMAKKLLPSTAEKLPDGKFPTSTLYAVHRALMQDPLAFRPQPGGQHRYGSRYEVSPLSEEQIVRRVTEYVRNFQEDQVLERKEDSPLSTFIVKAQRLIDKSREQREVTKTGTLGPAKQIDSQESILPLSDPKQQPYAQFSDTDIEIIRFFEYWTAMLSISRDSPTNAIGSQILRATKRYAGLELERSIGWTFLQEIGILPPWANRAPFNLRLPNMGFQLSEKVHTRNQDMQTASNLSSKDCVEALRNDWGKMPVYCVDDVGAHEIDDGVSVEQIRGKPDEHWVHIHAADPASRIEPSNDIASHAQQMITSVYFPDVMIPMIPRHITLSNFSLESDRPCLTFSARMNDAGEILETKVTPGYVRNVKSMTPSVVDTIVNGRRLEGKTSVYIVGGSDASGAPNSRERDMLQESDLSSQDKENLRKLHSLALARREKAVEKGALPPAANSNFFQYIPSISVRLNETTLRPTSTAHHYQTDPTIQITVSDVDSRSFDTTSNLMLLGGEIAAIWCHERNIPVPYRVSPQKPGSPDPIKYMREVLLPELETTGKIRLEHINKFHGMRGSVRPSSTPGPHLGIGVSKFAKCTSPLRRYGDLLLHWQVEAALLEEAKTGLSLVGSTRDDYLPFSKQHIDEILPWLDGRERLVRAQSLMATKSWVTSFVLRAWKYKQSSIPLPETFECSVTRVDHALKLKIGFLGFEGQFPLSEEYKDVKVGDVFECQFEDVCLVLGIVYLRPLRLVKKAEVD